MKLPSGESHITTLMIYIMSAFVVPSGHKPIPEPILTQFFVLYGITRPQGVNEVWIFGEICSSGLLSLHWFGNGLVPSGSKLQSSTTITCATITISILGSQTAPTSWHALMTVPEWLSTWAKGVKSLRSDRPQRQWHPFVPIQKE